LVLRVIFHRVLTIATPLGRRARPHLLHGSGPLVRVQRHHLEAMGVKFQGKIVGVEAGYPVTEQGQKLEVANVIWCTGFRTGFSWIDLPILDEYCEPRHEAGVVPEAPGLYFVGLHFLFSMSSEMIHGVGRDAQRIAKLVREQAPREKLGPESPAVPTRGVAFVPADAAHAPGAAANSSVRVG
jgi:putative flavoprotein involved in K+ transport